MVKERKKGSKIYTYWMASWREGDKTRNIHLGSTRKMGAEEARQKTRGDEGGGAGDAGASWRDGLTGHGLRGRVG